MLVGASGAGARSQPLAAVFLAPSYAPGQAASILVLGGRPVGIALENVGTSRVTRLALRPATRRPHAGGLLVQARVPALASGVYVARVTGVGGQVARAPLVVRPRRLGGSRVAVVMSTNTWQAYNFWDGDSWYLNPAVHAVRLDRPYAGGGLPTHFHSYVSGFVRWLARNRLAADFLSDDDLERFASGAQLRRLYREIVFPSHEEYVTAHVFDLVEGYRNLGGRIAFLSANNFFYKVVRSGNVLQGRWRWRDLGRPEASLVGAQYLDWFQNRYPNRPYVVSGIRSAPWLFRGTGLRNGDLIPGRFGIEIDATTAASPRGVAVLARIPDAFGPGQTAEMTYYRTPRGAEVFDAGTINFGASALQPVVGRMLLNLWAHLLAP